MPAGEDLHEKKLSRLIFSSQMVGICLWLVGDIANYASVPIIYCGAQAESKSTMASTSRECFILSSKKNNLIK